VSAWGGDYCVWKEATSPGCTGTPTPCSDLGDNCSSQQGCTLINYGYESGDSCYQDNGCTIPCKVTTNCVDFLNESTWDGTVVRRDDSYVIVGSGNISICTDVYSLPTTTAPAIIINTSGDTYIDFSGSTINGSGDGIGIEVLSPMNTITIANVKVTGYDKGILWRAPGPSVEDSKIVNSEIYGNDKGIYVDSPPEIGKFSRVGIFKSSIHHNLKKGIVFKGNVLGLVQGNTIGKGGCLQARNIIDKNNIYESCLDSPLISGEKPAAVKVLKTSTEEPVRRYLSDGVKFTNITLSKIKTNTYIKPPAEEKVIYKRLAIKKAENIMVVWPEQVEVKEELNKENFVLKDNIVSLNTSSAPSYNTTANITLFVGDCENVSIYMWEGFATSASEVIQKGVPCPPEVCQNVGCRDGVVTFTVKHFTSYAAGDPAEPFISSVEINPSEPSSDDNLACSAVAVDNDTSLLEVEFNWYRNGVPVPAYDNTETCSSGVDCTSSVIIPSSATAVGDEWTCSARAFDSSHYSDWMNDTVKIVYVVSEDCTNGIDDDGDGLVDCCDSDCACPSGYTCDLNSCSCVYSGGGDGTHKQFSVTLNSTCAGQPILIFVKRSTGGAVSDARVYVNDGYIGTTDYSGKLVYTFDIGTSSLEVTKSGYTKYTHDYRFVDCSLSPVVNCSCSINAQCADTEYCDGCYCQELVCPEGSVPIDHECVSLNECTDDSDCEDNMTCVDNVCEPVICDCGYVEDHECHPYTCCADTDCPDGEICAGHECYAPPENVNREEARGAITQIVKEIEKIEEQNITSTPEIKQIIDLAKEKLKQGDYEGAQALVKEAEKFAQSGKKTTYDYLWMFILLLLVLMIIVWLTRKKKGKIIGYKKSKGTKDKLEVLVLVDGKTKNVVITKTEFEALGLGKLKTLKKPAYNIRGSGYTWVEPKKEIKI